MLRTGVTSPARALLKPASSTRSILKRPASLPLSPSAFSFAASFSALAQSEKLSPHVHFAASPAMVVTFSALSPNTYDRGAIIVSPASMDVSSWANRVYSPSADAFKLSDPPAPKRKSERNLTIPVLEDPRSPKPYVSEATARFEELTLHVPRSTRGIDALAKALSTYPRSPYPSAPVSPRADSENVNEDVENRGHTSGRWPTVNTVSDKRSSSLTRARSLQETKRRSGPRLETTAAQQFLTPVQESPRVTITKPPPLNLDGDACLSHAFWESVSLEPGNMLSPSVRGHEAMMSPTLPTIMFGKKDGTLWSPGLPKKARPNMRLPLSPTAPKAQLRKSVVASPSPNDPFAAFPSFSIALSGSVASIAYPPRVLREAD